MSSISNALELISKAVAQQATGLTFTELQESTSVPQSSAHRIVKELVKLRILDFDPKGKTYRGGLLLATLGSQVLSEYSLRKIARPSLERLHDDLGQVVTLGIRDGASGIYIDKIESSEMGYRLHSEIGKSFPLHCTAMGKILLAHADIDTQKKLLRKKMSAMTPQTITDPQELQKALERVLEDGYAIDNEEITRGLICVAAPIFGIDQTVIGALSFTCQKYMFAELKQTTIVEKVKSAAKFASA